MMLEEVRKLMPAELTGQELDELSRSVRQGMRDAPDAVEAVRMMPDADLPGLRQLLVGTLLQMLRESGKLS